MESYNILIFVELVPTEETSEFGRKQVLLFPKICRTSIFVKYYNNKHCVCFHLLYCILSKITLLSFWKLLSYFTDNFPHPFYFCFWNSINQILKVLDESTNLLIFLFYCMSPYLFAFLPRNCSHLLSSSMLSHTGSEAKRSYL